MNNSYRRRRKRSNPLTGIIVFLAAAGIFLLLSTTVFFNTEYIRVTGASNYTAEEIIEASGIKAGDNLVRLNAEKCSSDITSKLVYIETAKLSRSFPNTIIINVEASVPEANFITDGGIYLISRGGKILEKSTEPKAGLYNFTGTFPRTDLMPGDTYTSADEHKDSAVLKMMELLNTGSYEKVTSVDVTDRSDITCVYDGRITVKLGAILDMDYKLSFAKEIIETKIGDKTEGTLTILSDGDSASFLDKESLENNAKVYSDNMAALSEASDGESEESEITSETSRQQQIME